MQLHLQLVLFLQLRSRLQLLLSGYPGSKSPCSALMLSRTVEALQFTSQYVDGIVRHA